jgi:Flp pilus assembly protein TadG
MMASLSAVFRAKARGQSAIFVAIMLPFLVAFTLLVVEVAERWLEVAMVEDALQQATRSAVQLLDYSSLARGEEGLRATADCRNVTWNQQAACAPLLSVARQFLITNLASVRGLDETPTELASRVRWTVLPNGGTCSYTSTAVTAVTETTPLICAEVRPVMRGIVGWGAYTPLVVAADTLDPVQP